ncbi:MAG: peptidase M4, partial [Methanotrichaceae archaeon]
MNRNLIIALGVVALTLLAVLAFNQMMYRPGYSPDSVSPPWRMGPGMGPGMMYGPGYNYSFGPGMMGYGDMMALYYPDAKPVSS